MKKIAFIPARSGSKRVPDKNIKILGDHPLLAYSVSAALDSKIFDDVVCVTDSDKYANIARYYGAQVPELRPPEISSDMSSDIEWVRWILGLLKSKNRHYDIFSILRPTSPFRSAQTIIHAFELFENNLGADSLRAVEKCKQHPGKMWVIRNNRMLPILPFQNNSTPWHSSQINALPEVYVQNASLEIAWSRVANEENNIAGQVIIPFISGEFDGFDINEPEDWILANHYINNCKARLPPVRLPAYQVIHKY